MFTKEKKNNKINLFLLIIGLCVFKYNQQTNRFVRKFRHIFYVVGMLITYTYYAAVALLFQNRVVVSTTVTENTFNTVSQLLLDVLLIYAFPALIFTSVISGSAQANYLNEIKRFDQAFGVASDNGQQIAKRFWIECIVWHGYYSLIVNPLDAYLYKLLYVEKQLYFWSFTISAIGIGTFISYLSLASEMFFIRMQTLKTNLKLYLKTMDERLVHTFGMLSDLFTLRDDFQEAYGLVIQCLVQIIMTQSLFNIYFSILLVSDTEFSTAGLVDYLVYYIPIQLRIVFLVRQLNGFGLEVNFNIRNNYEIVIKL